MKYKNQMVIGRVGMLSAKNFKKQFSRNLLLELNHFLDANPEHREYDGHRHGSMGPHLGSLEPSHHGPNSDGPHDLGPRTMSKEEVQNDLAKLQYELEDLTNQLETIEQIKSKPRPR